MVQDFSFPCYIYVMKKVFIVHGFEGSPNGGWRPWLMAELEKLDIYACALSMPDPAHPSPDEWVAEIARHVERNRGDEIYLVGHSLGVPAILRYLESMPETLSVSGAVLVSGPCIKTEHEVLAPFFDPPFDLTAIKSRVQKFAIIHGDNDPVVPLDQAQTLSKELRAPLTIVPNGCHLNGSAGWYALPQCLEALMYMTTKAPA